MHASVCLDQRNAVSPGSAYERVLAKDWQTKTHKVKRKEKNNPPRFLSVVFGGYQNKRILVNE